MQKSPLARPIAVAAVCRATVRLAANHQPGTLSPNASGLVAWDVFDAVLTPGDVMLLLSWRDQAAAETFENAASLNDGARLRRIRVVRDYGMFDRREAPQYYPDAVRSHADRA